MDPDFHLVAFDEIPWQSPSVGARVKAVVRGDKRLRLVEFALDFVEPDWCTKEHVGFVIQGAMEIEIAGRVMGFKAGDGLAIPGGDGDRHRHRVTRETTILFLVEPV
jgi:quercetin dioxygenase-like cupin family protein